MAENSNVLNLSLDVEQEPVQIEREFETDSVIVKLRPGANARTINSLQNKLNVSEVEETQTLGLELWEIEDISVVEAIATYSENPAIEYIEPNYEVSINDFPNDPSFNELWGLNNTGQTGGVEDADIDAPEAWDIETGSDVVVGVIDTGIDYTHPDLDDNVWVNEGEIPDNGIDDDGNGYVDDYHGYDFVNDDGDPFDDNGHGTHVSGTIAAEGDNGIGVTGVNWDAEVMGLKFLDSAGFGDTFDAIQAVEYATLMGADLTNNSWGGGGFSQALYDAIAAAGEQGKLFVAAAGNSSSDTDVFPEYPGSYDLDNIISVAATTDGDLLAGFSNYGATSVDLGAPGQDILSTTPNNSYSSFNGTSMASPHVAGVVSLLLSQFPGLSPQEVKERIMGTSDPIAALEGVTVSGGRLNAFNALLAEEAGSIEGSKWNDLDQDGVKDEGESGLEGWTIYLDENQNGELDEEEPFRVTDAEGNYAFSFLEPGDYSVAEVLQPGWTQTFPDDTHDVILGESETISNLNFGNYLSDPATISGVKWHDLNQDGVKDESEPTLEDWTIYLDTNNNGQLDEGEVSTVTDVNGNYSFNNLEPDVYIVAEQLQPGWLQTSPPSGFIAEIFNADFSDSSGNPSLDGFTIDNSGAPVEGLWHLSTGRGEQPGHSADDSMYFGTGEGADGGGNYDVGDTAGRIVSPEIDLTEVSSAELSFNYFLETENGAPFYDNARVFVVENGGVLTEITSNADELEDPTTGWTNATVDLTPYAGSSVQLQFDFSTGDDVLNAFEGWYVDDVTVNSIGTGTHVVDLAPGETANNLNFGNFELESGSISGSKWNDLDGDSERDEGEPGLADWTIYLDQNQNGELDSDELFEVTDANGNYTFTDLPATTYTVAEVLQDGWQQTLPGSGIVFDDPADDTFGFESPQIDIESVNAFVSGGNVNLVMSFFTPISAPSTGAPEGVVGYWDLDLDQDSTTGAPSNQSGFAPPEQQGGPLGAEIYIDLFSEEFQPGSVSLIDTNTFETIGTAPITYDSNSLEIQIPLSLLDDDGSLNYGTIVGTFFEPTDAAPDTEFGVLGEFPADSEEDITPLPPTIERDWSSLSNPQVDPKSSVSSASQQQNSEVDTTNSTDVITAAVPGTYTVELGAGEAVTDIDFGNQEILPGEIRGSKWNDLDGNGVRDEGEPGIANWTIYLDDNQNGELDEGEVSTVTDANGEYVFTDVEPGSYTVTEVVEEGWQPTFPVSFEYESTDSNQPEGPVYDWVDISGVGTELNLSDDDFAEVELPFTFPFFEQEKADVRISSNGYLAFSTEAFDYTNDPIPSTQQPNDIIAPFWDDLNPSDGGNIYYYYDETDEQFIVQYQDLPRFEDGGSLTFQTILEADGSILYQYNNMNGTLDSATIGVENVNGSEGLEVAYNEAYVENELAVSIEPVPGNLQPYNITVDSGEVVSDLDFGNLDTDPDPEPEPPSLIIGTPGDDEIIVTAGSTRVFALGGDDFVDASSSSGNNELYGQAGEDQLFASTGDRLFGGNDNDFLDASQGSGNNELFGNRGDDILLAGGEDRLFGRNDNDILVASDTGVLSFASDLDDVLTQADRQGISNIIEQSGDDLAANTVEPGDNLLDGGSGSDLLFAGMGDRAFGRNGDDLLFVSDGDNQLTGGGGADQFWIVAGALPSSANTVTDFQIDTDVLGIGGSELTFEDLSIIQQGQNTLISALDTDIAILEGIQADDIDSSSFIFV